MKIKIKFSHEMELDIYPDQEAWDEADSEQRNIYTKERVLEYFQDNVDEIFEEMIVNNETLRIIM